MTTTQTATTQRVTYRRTRHGEWVVYGPADIIRPLRDVEVTTRDGRTRIEPIASVGKAFKVDGVLMRYGYIDQEARRELREQRRRQRTTNRRGPWWDSPRERALAARDGDPSAWD